MARINRQLNLVLTIEREDKSLLYVHSTPIGSEVFDTYFLPIAKTFGQIYANGLGFAGAPRIADKLLRQVSQELGVWADDPANGRIGVEHGLLGEIKRLTTVFAPSEKGWQQMPFDAAEKTGTIDAADASEVMSGLCFFSAVSSVAQRSQVRQYLEIGFHQWDVQITSSDAMAFKSSLPTLTLVANSGGTAAA